MACATASSNALSAEAPGYEEGWEGSGYKPADQRAALNDVAELLKMSNRRFYYPETKWRCTFDYTPTQMIDGSTAARILHEALLNAHLVPYTYADYLAEFNAPGNRHINPDRTTWSPVNLAGFTKTPGGALPLLSEPCSIISRDGIILLLYLPGYLREGVQNAVSSAFREIANAPKTDFKVRSDRRWRTGDMHYTLQTPEPKPGSTLLSPSWFMPAKDGTIDTKFLPAPTPSLRPAKHGHAGLKFLTRTAWASRLVGATLKFLQPAQYNAALNGWERMEESEYALCREDVKHDAEMALSEWASPYSTWQVFTNRETPLHYDRNGHQYCYDALTTAGFYREGRFECPSVGARFVYNSGTVIFILGKTMEHGVGPVVGPRHCIAQFIRPEVVTHFAGQDVDFGKPPNVWEVAQAAGLSLDRAKFLK